MSTEKKLTVTITKDHPAPCWYNGLIGETFEVIDLGRDYVLAEDYPDRTCWHHIDKTDCEPQTPTNAETK